MRIEQVGPTLDNATLTLDGTSQSVSGKALSAAISRDGTRAYIGGHSGVWRSDDGGVTWSHPERPQPGPGQVTSGALVPPNVYSLAISPANHDIVFAATGNDARSPAQSGVYRSTDGAQTWTRVAAAPATPNGATPIFQASQVVVASDDANIVFAAAGSAILRSTDGGTTWQSLHPSTNVNDRFWHVVTGVAFQGERWVYAVGNHVWWSRDGGNTWTADPVADTHHLGLGPSTVTGVSGQCLSIHPTDPHQLFLTMSDFSIWHGTFAEAPAGASTWTSIPPIPVIPNGPTDSGGNFVVPYVTADGRLFLVSSDRRTTCIATGIPAATAAWTRIEDGNCHCDPHAITFTPDFVPAVAGGSPATHGRVILVNDGGVSLSTDGGHSWTHGKGLATLNTINVSVNSTGAKGVPTLGFGGGDNSGYASADGGAHWRTQDYLGGDNDCAFSDPLQPTRAIVFAPRSTANGVGRQVFLYSSGSNNPPNLATGTGDRKIILGPPTLPPPSTNTHAGWNTVSWFVVHGYRPLVLTGIGEQPTADVDMIIVRFTATAGFVMRTTKLSQIASANDWVSTATADGPGVKAFQVGPPLPVSDGGVVQASGGHASPTIYFSDVVRGIEGDGTGSMKVWKWSAGMPAWQQIVPPVSGVSPNAPATAQRFFVDPYRPNLIYVLSESHVFRSDNGGQTWVIDTFLEAQMTQNGAYPIVVGFDESPAETLIRDMQFDPHRPGTRFASGPAGVFATYDGVHWSALVVSEPMALRPNMITYDYRSCPRAVYVATLNSGLLRLSPIPPDWDYPMNSLQGATGFITLLRVHEIGSGYGPPDDELDADVIVWLDSEPEKAFGFKLRTGADEPDNAGKLQLLRDAFNHNRRVRLDFTRTGCRTGQIVRVMDQP